MTPTLAPAAPTAAPTASPVLSGPAAQLTAAADPFAPHLVPAGFQRQPADPVVETQLRYRRCHWCHSASAGTCLLCPVCGSADLEPAVASGQGTVQRLLRPTRRGPHLGRPYLIVLDEGFTVQAAVLGGLPGAVPIGARVQLVTSEEGGRVLTFRLVPRI
ncbi:Zn-ribbon domain-containing OB-fold protein [Kitasatospora sp. NPDC059646]|uniref:Zn-ribbon domain-containing OB-fold protein n=1 Tax=Kitasatospora sp. NPDC059646 TaxID=3346893 RepID=UPI0036D1DAED